MDVAGKTAIGVGDEAMGIIGGAELFRSGPLEQLYRDVRAAIIHPFGGHDVFGLLGKLAFDIPLDTMLRWV